MSAHLVLVWTAVYLFLNLGGCSGRDICSRYAVLKEIDSFILSEKQTTLATLTFDPIKDLIFTLQSKTPDFEKHLNEFSLSSKLANLSEENFFPFSQDQNLIPINGFRNNFSESCRTVSGFIPKLSNLKNLPLLAKAMNNLGLKNIPVNPEISKKQIVTGNGFPLGAPAPSGLANMDKSFPLLSFPKDDKGVEHYFINLAENDAAHKQPITGLCVKTNYPWSRKGYQKQSWINLTKILKNLLPEINNLSGRFDSFLTYKQPLFSNSSFNFSSLPQVIEMPVPAALRKVAEVISKFSDTFEWGALKNSDTLQFTNLISNLESLRSLFTKKAKLNRFKANVKMADDFKISKFPFIPDLGFLSPTTKVLDSEFHLLDMLDMDADGTGDLAVGQLTVGFKDQLNLVQIFKILPLFYKNQQIKENLYLIKAKDSSLSSTVPEPTGCKPSEDETGPKICSDLAFKVVDLKNMSSCIQALTGSEEIQNCPLQSIETSFVAHRVDCSDDHNLVIDSRTPLELAPVCNGNTNKPFNAQYFPLFMNTDCGIKAIDDEGDFTILPQLEYFAESENLNPEPIYPYTNLENIIEVVHNFFTDPSISGVIKLGVFLGSMALIIIIVVVILVVCILKNPKCGETVCRSCCKDCKNCQNGCACCQQDQDKPLPFNPTYKSRHSPPSETDVYEEPVAPVQRRRRQDSIRSHNSGPSAPALSNDSNDETLTLQEMSPFLDRIPSNASDVSRVSRQSRRGKTKVHRKLEF